MYRKVYRQEGGLSNLGSEAFMRQEVDKSLAKFKQRSRNVGQQARSRLLGLPQSINNLKNKNISNILNIENITGIDKVNKLSSDYYDSTKGDEANLARHAAASRELANRLTPNIPGGKYIGNLLSFGGGAAEELSDLGQRGISYLPSAWDDIKANITGLNYPSGTTPAEIYKDVYGTNNPQDDYGGVQEAIQNQVQTPGVTITDSRHPDYALFNQEQRTSYDEASLRRKGYSEQDINRLHQEGRIDTAINSVDPFVSIADSRHPEYALYNYVPPVNAFQKVNNEVLKPVQEQQQGLPSLMKIVDEQRNPTPVVPSNATGFKSKADAMADHNEKYRGGMVNVYQNADGSWSYQPPYDLDSPPARPLGLPITPGGPAL